MLLRSRSDHGRCRARRIKTTEKRVSVWVFEKRDAEMERMTPTGKEKTMELLKTEVRTHF